MSEEVRLGRYLYTPRQPEQRPQQPPESNRRAKLAGFQQKSSALPRHMQSEKATSSATSLHGSAKEDADFDLPSPSTAPLTHYIFRNNPLHDLESVVWLSFFVLLVLEFQNEPDGKGGYKHSAQTLQDFTDAQKVLAWKIFCKPEVRRDVMGSIIAKID